MYDEGRSDGWSRVGGQTDKCTVLYMTYLSLVQVRQVKFEFERRKMECICVCVSIAKCEKKSRYV